MFKRKAKEPKPAKEKKPKQKRGPIEITFTKIYVVAIGLLCVFVVSGGMKTTFNTWQNIRQLDYANNLAAKNISQEDQNQTDEPTSTENSFLPAEVLSEPKPKAISAKELRALLIEDETKAKEAEAQNPKPIVPQASAKKQEEAEKAARAAAPATPAQNKPSQTPKAPQSTNPASTNAPTPAPEKQKPEVKPEVTPATKSEPEVKKTGDLLDDQALLENILNKRPIFTKGGKLKNTEETAGPGSGLDF